jgi:glycosyltransferase involved in cell wall biosynthesis
MIIYAVNIHVGGGKVLLDELLRATPLSELDHLYVDQRYSLPEGLPPDSVTRVKPTIFHRLAAEFKLKSKSRRAERVLMFGNLPPIFKLPTHVVLYLQNVLLLQDIGLTGFKVKTKLRLAIEKIWLKFFRHNIDEIWVQTTHVADLSSSLFERAKIKIRPIIPLELQGEPIKKNSKKFLYDFIYVASDEPHKNIGRLVSAWSLLGRNGIHPKLILVLGPVSARSVERFKPDPKLGIEVFRNLSRQDLFGLYAQSKALIYPSILESFGLPIIEAKKFGLRILASDLPYARALNCVDQFFDPSSAEKIAEAVTIFLNTPLV